MDDMNTNCVGLHLIGGFFFPQFFFLFIYNRLLYTDYYNFIRQDIIFRKIGMISASGLQFVHFMGGFLARSIL
jgi:hypothetical protein